MSQIDKRQWTARKDMDRNKSVKIQAIQKGEYKLRQEQKGDGGSINYQETQTKMNEWRWLNCVIQALIGTLQSHSTHMHIHEKLLCHELHKVKKLWAMQFLNLYECRMNLYQCRLWHSQINLGKTPHARLGKTINRIRKTCGNCLNPE
jgi:hypothetical protein